MSVRGLLPLGFLFIGICVFLATSRSNENQALRLEPVSFAPVRERPTWLKDGIVAAAYMEPLTFLLRRGGESADISRQWAAEFNEETMRRFKQAGINLVFVNLHKGAGLKAEANDIEAARKFTELAHRRGLKVGGYVGASMMYETFFQELPEARSWQQVDEFGRPIYYTGDQTFRYMACRNNPGYQAFIQKVLRLGIEDLKLDLIHFDQIRWPAEPLSCRCSYCQEQFRTFVRRRYNEPLARLRFGFARFDGVIPPPYGLNGPPIHLGSLRNPLMQEWALFRATSLAQRYGEYHNYIHRLNPQTALQGNPSMNPAVNVGFIFGVDHQQLLDHGDMVWSEEPNNAGWTADGRLVSKVRSFKAARIMGKPVFVWMASPVPYVFEGPITLRLAEGLAYNDMNLGVVAGRDVGGVAISPETQRYIDFFRAHSKDLVDTITVADAAILRSFASIEFNPARSNLSTVLFEQTLIQSKIPFEIIFDRHLKDLSKYKVLILANQDALADEQLDAIRRFVKNGGGLVATEETSLLTDWRLQRGKFGLVDLFGIDRPPSPEAPNEPIRREVGKGRVAYVPRVEPATTPPPPRLDYYLTNEHWKLPLNFPQLVESVKWAASGTLSASVDAPLWVTAELTEQKSSNTRLLHLVNFKPGEPVRNIHVAVRIPDRLRLREAVLDTPDGGAAHKLQASVQNGTASFDVPLLKTYNLVLLHLEK